MSHRHRNVIKTTNEKPQEDWMTRRWRPLMGYIYMAICACDFILFPMLWSMTQAVYHIIPFVQWQPLTLQGAGMIHIAFGAILGITAFGRTKEKLAGAEQGGIDLGPGTTYQPPSMGGMNSGMNTGMGGMNSGMNTGMGGINSGMNTGMSGGFGSQTNNFGSTTTGAFGSGTPTAPTTSGFSTPSAGSSPSGFGAGFANPSPTTNNVTDTQVNVVNINENVTTVSKPKPKGPPQLFPEK